MPEQPMYGGARAQLGDAASPFAIPAIGTDASQKAIQRGAAAMDETVKQYFKIQDFGEDQRVESEVRNTLTDFETEFKRRASLASGSSSEALYDSDGSLREGAVQDLADEYARKIDEIQGGFVLPESRMKSDAMRQRISSGMTMDAYRQAVGLSIKRTKEAFKEGLEGDLLRKDYDSARQRYTNAHQASVIDEAAMKNGIYQVDRADASGRFDNLAATNPSGAYDLLNSEDYKNLFSPAELESMRRGLAARRDSDANDFFKSFVLTKPDAGDGKKSKKEGGNALAQSGLFTANEIRWGTLMQAGKGGMVINEIRSEAIDEARSFDPSLSDDGMELAREKYMDKYLRYESIGISKEFLNRQWKAADDLRKTLKTPTLNVKDRLDLLQRSGLLQNQGAFNSVEQKFYNATFGDSKKWDEGGEYYNRFLGEFDYGGKTGVDLYKKYIANARKKYSDGLKFQITERFNSWRENEGRDATQAEQQIKLVDLTRKITGNRDITFADDGPSLMDQAREWSAKAQKSKFDTLVTKQGKAIPWDFSQQEPPIQRVSVGFDTTRKDLPDGILLPRSMMDGVKEGEDAVILTFDNKHLKAATVVGVCEGDSPQLTYAAAQRGRYDFRKSYDLDMRIIKEKEAQPLLRAQEAALPSGKSVKVNEAKLGGLAPYKQAFIDAGKKYGMTPDQVKIGMSIAMLETGRGSSHAFRIKNNAMGISPNGGGPRSFGSVEEGIDYGMRNLKKNYFDKGLTTLEQIGAVYAPIGANNDPGNSNRYWSTGVRKSYNSISL